MFCRALTVAFAVAALAVPVSQAQLERLTQDGTQTTQTKMIPYYPRLGLRVDNSVNAGQRTFYRPDDRGFAAGIGSAQTTSSSAQLARLPWEGGGTQTTQTMQAVRPDDRGEVAGIGIAPVTPQATASSSSGTDWTTLFVAVVAGLALVLLIGGAVAVTARRHGENVAV